MRRMRCIAFDSHTYCTWGLAQDEERKVLREQRVGHARGALRGFLLAKPWRSRDTYPHWCRDRACAPNADAVRLHRPEAFRWVLRNENSPADSAGCRAAAEKTAF